MGNLILRRLSERQTDWLILRITQLNKVLERSADVLMITSLFLWMIVVLLWLFRPLFIWLTK